MNGEVFCYTGSHRSSTASLFGLVRFRLGWPWRFHFEDDEMTIITVQSSNTSEPSRQQNFLTLFTSCPDGGARGPIPRHSALNDTVLLMNEYPGIGWPAIHTSPVLDSTAAADRLGFIALWPKSAMGADNSNEKGCFTLTFLALQVSHFPATVMSLDESNSARICTRRHGRKKAHMGTLHVHIASCRSSPFAAWVGYRLASELSSKKLGDTAIGTPRHLGLRGGYGRFHGTTTAAEQQN